MPKSILEAVKMGLWDYEPIVMDYSEFEASDAMPGTREKLSILADRIRQGMPLWHVADRNDMESPPPMRIKPR
jgi:hypothetical protein